MSTLIQHAFCNNRKSQQIWLVGMDTNQTSTRSMGPGTARIFSVDPRRDIGPRSAERAHACDDGVSSTRCMIRPDQGEGFSSEILGGRESFTFNSGGVSKTVNVRDFSTMPRKKVEESNANCGHTSLQFCNPNSNAMSGSLHGMGSNWLPVNLEQTEGPAQELTIPGRCEYSAKHQSSAMCHGRGGVVCYFFVFVWFCLPPRAGNMLCISRTCFESRGRLFRRRGARDQILFSRI